MNKPQLAGKYEIYILDRLCLRIIEVYLAWEVHLQLFFIDPRRQ